MMRIRTVYKVHVSVNKVAYTETRQMFTLLQSTHISETFMLTKLHIINAPMLHVSLTVGVYIFTWKLTRIVSIYRALFTRIKLICNITTSQWQLFANVEILTAKLR